MEAHVIISDHKERHLTNIVLPTGMVMASLIVWISQSFLRLSEFLVMIEYLQKDHTAIGRYCSDQLNRQQELIKEKRLTTGIFFLQNNAPAHASLVTMATIHEFERIRQTWPPQLQFHPK